MSHSQSRAERTESSQYRKSGRSNDHRNFSGGGTKGSIGTGGGATAPTNTSSYNSNSSQPSLSSNRSFKKHNNVKGGIPRGSALSGQAANSDPNNHSAPRAIQNGAHSQLPSEGATNVPITVMTVEPTDVTTPKATRAPRAPSSNASAANSDPKHTPVPVTPAKVPAEASRSFPLQCGSIDPGLMIGIKIPARTSSAPSNLDEQKHDQAHYDTLGAPPAMPIPSIPRQQLPKKDGGSVDQSAAAEIHHTSKPKRDVQVSAPPPVSQTQKPSMQHPIPGMLMQMPFHHPQVPVQFGGPNPQIQSQAMLTTSLPMPIPMPMPLQIGNPSVQQPIFVPGLQPHPLQSQGILHQGQNLNFTSRMGPQIIPQLGNIGISIAPQFPQQQPGKFGGPRKAVRIIHPDTHEELRLDGSPAPRSHPNVPPQSQLVSSFPPAHPPNYYPNSYSASPMSWDPLNTSLPALQPQRYYSQIPIKAAGSSYGEKDAASLASSPCAPKGGSVKVSRLSQTDAEASSQSSVQQSKPGLGPTSKSVSEASKTAVPSGSDSVQSPTPNSLSPGFPAEKLSRGKKKIKKSLKKLDRVSAAPSGKKKRKELRKELLKKLDSSGSTSDLYLAYKGPEEKKESVTSAEITENASSCNLEAISSDVSQKDVRKGEDGHSKVEPDDWEDVADMSTPKLDTSENGNQVDGSGEDGNGAMTKKYSRDFLLKFSVQCTDLLEGFEYAPHIAEALISSNVCVSRKSCPSSGRITDRSRLDHRGSGLGEGQMQSLVPQIGVPRDSPDSERWLRGIAFQKGLLPSPQTLLQIPIKAAGSSYGEKDAASLASSPCAPKGGSVKVSRLSQKDAEASSQSSVQQSKPGLGPTSKSVSEASKTAAPSGSDSVQSPAPNSLSPGLPAEKLSRGKKKLKNILKKLDRVSAAPS